MNFSKINKSDKIFFSIIPIITIVAGVLVYALQLNSPPIRSDGLGYYSYLPSVFIHGDITMRSVMQERADKYNDPIPDNWNGVNLQKNGNFLDKYTMGEAVLMLPFFIPAHILSYIFHQTPNGFTLFYQAFLGFAGLFYMLLGLFIVKKILERYFKPKTIYITLLVILFGTNLFHYGTYDSIFSHAYSFFLFAAFLYFLPTWFGNISRIRNSIILGLLVGLIVLVRPTNIVFPLIFILLWGINLKNVGERLKLFWRNKKSLFISVIISIIVFLPQLIYWKIVTGNFLMFSYQGEYFDFLHPQILNVLFSVQKGLIFWSPLVALGILGIILLKGKLKSWLIPTIMFLVINLIIISSWWAWSYGGGFGHRAFIESFTVISIPLAAVIERILSLKNTKLRRIILVFIFILTIIAIYLMLNYWTGSLKPDGTTLGQFVRLFIRK